MGMFDDVRIRYSLPWPEVQDVKWQSKDTPCCLDNYEIRKDGTLWHETYESRWEEDESSPLGMVMHRDNRQWEQVLWKGELEVHEFIRHDDTPGGWAYSVRFWFRDGVVKDVIYKKWDTCEEGEKP